MLREQPLGSGLWQRWDTQLCGTHPIPSPCPSAEGESQVPRGPLLGGALCHGPGEPRPCWVGAGGSRAPSASGSPPRWPGGGRGAEGEGAGSFFNFFPLRGTMSFKSELVCLGCATMAKPRACALGAGAVLGRGGCWLLSKAFLSPKQSLITGVKLVPAKHRRGCQRPFLLAWLPPPHRPTSPSRGSGSVHPDKICISAVKNK